MENSIISITGMGSASGLGNKQSEILGCYQCEQSFLHKKCFGTEAFIVGMLSESTKNEVLQLKKENHQYKNLDLSVLYALFASRIALKQAGWKENTDVGINIGSSRGATGLFEEYFTTFLRENSCSTKVSPTTTLGNISSWVMQDAKSTGISLSHSITCSTALHAVLNGAAWLRSGMAKQFIVGGSEAPLTHFTLKQMSALKVYTQMEGKFPCLPLKMDKKQNTMALGEGACLFCIEKGVKNNALALIVGMGYASESLTHSVSISEHGDCFQKSMRMALEHSGASTIDVIIPHATGTIKGDQAEMNAIQSVFGEKIPAMTSNKWKIGHTFGASGAFSMEMAIQMLQNQVFFPIPYLKEQKIPQKIENILINAIGFGGNAVSIILKRAQNGA